MPQKATVPGVCAYCQAAFFAQPRDIARGRGRFCSARCSGAAGGKRTGQTHPQSGAGNHNFKHGDPVAAVLQWQRENPKKYAAHKYVRWMVRTGRMIKPAACETCDRKTHRLDAHHADYDRKKLVRWLCRPCHNAHHRAVRAARQALPKGQIELDY
jgi:hypothetical protein